MRALRRRREGEGCGGVGAVILIETVNVEEPIDACDGEHELHVAYHVTHCDAQM